MGSNRRCIIVAGQSNAEGLGAHLQEFLPSREILELAIGGSTLVPLQIHPDPPECWLRVYTGTAPLQQLLDLAAGRDVEAVWFVQGESEALHGCTAEAYRNCMELFYAKLCGFWGSWFLPSPVAAIHPMYTHRRPVLEAQYGWGRTLGRYLGPEYHDLFGEDRVHLDDQGRREFAKRFSEMSLWHV